MSLAKIVGTKEKPATYPMPDDVYRAVNYIADFWKSEHLIGGGRGIIQAEEIHRAAPFIADQFVFVQNRNMGGAGRRLYHVVVSFDRVIDDLTPDEIQVIAEGIVSRYPKYQSVYALHEDTENLHLHILFNNISIYEECKNISYFINIIDISNYVYKKLDEYTYAKSRPRYQRKKALDAVAKDKFWHTDPPRAYPYCGGK